MQKQLYFDLTHYPTLYKFTEPVAPPSSPVIGREKDIEAVLSALYRPIIRNVMLLAPAGVGKTTLIRELARRDTQRAYYSVKISDLTVTDGHTSNVEALAANRVNRISEEVQNYQKANKQEIVLFMDEIHQLIHSAPSALQALKPILADSGQSNVKVIAATTYQEYIDNLQSDQALDERFQKIKLSKIDATTTIKILQKTAQKYLNEGEISLQLIKQIVDVAERYLPSEEQPRKSINILDSMIGRHNALNQPLNTDLLRTVMLQNNGIEIDWNVNVEKVKKYLNSRVLDQRLAINEVCKRLYISVEGLSDSNRPQASFLFAGATGVGKTELARSLAKALFGSEEAMIRFDMSEYADARDLNVFKDRLTDMIWQRPFTVLLLDEVEKASSAIRKLLLQVLDEGHLTNRYGRVTVFTNCYLIMTTNSGQNIFKDIQGFVDGKTANIREENMTKYNKIIRRALIDTNSNSENSTKFPPELLNRVDVVIPFQPLGREAKIAVTKLRMSELVLRMKRVFGINLSFDEDVVGYIALENTSDSTDSGAGREIRRLLQDEILAPLAKFMNNNPNVSNIGIKIEGTMAYTDPTKLRGYGTAHVVVGQIA